jgi:hypothetical protein
MRTVLFFLFLFLISMSADEAHDIMKKLDENMRGQNIYIQMRMRVVSLGYERMMQMQSWSQGTKKSFVKIPPSMMLQNWMGSNITNDDMVKQSSIIEDYEPKILKKEGSVYTIELLPKRGCSGCLGENHHPYRHRDLHLR